jgi:transcriptional regulator with XRE-family HTH domain
MAFSGKRLKELREMRGLTQVELAALAQTSQSNMFKWEAQNRTPDPDKLVILADVLGTTIDYLMGRTASRDMENPLTPGEERVLSAYRGGDYGDLLEMVAEKMKARRGDDKA